jgi:hypothetical protein
MCPCPLAAVLAASLAATVRAETYDVATFAPPAGWTRTEKRDLVVFERRGDAGGSCLAAVYKARAGSGDAERDFREEWDFVVVKALHFKTPPEVERSRDGGWTRLVGKIETLQDGREATTELHVASGGGLVATLLANQSDRSCAGSLRAFLASVRLAPPGEPRPGVAAAPATAAPPAPRAAGAGASLSGPPPVGVWIGSTTGAIAIDTEVGSGRAVRYDALKRKLVWRVLFADGRAFSGLPVTGLADLDVARSQAEEASGRFVGGSWGTWSLSGTRGEIRTTSGGRVEPFSLEGGVLRVDGRFDLVRAPDVTGLRLDGEWTTFPNPEDPWLDEPGCRQVIRFGRDGRFVDRGAFVSDTRFPERSREDAPGEGTYEVRDYTLVLRHADGRVVRRSLSGAAGGDPRKDDRFLLVLGQPFVKRR